MYSVCINNKTCICPTTVPSVENEVCGTNEETYDNIEALKVSICAANEDVTKDYDGECKGKYLLNQHFYAPPVLNLTISTY